MSETKRIALITGITGQDGSYLAELLLEKNYEVWGFIRRSSSINTHRIEHIFNELKLRYGDLSDGINILNILLLFVLFTFSGSVVSTYCCLLFTTCVVYSIEACINLFFIFPLIIY